MFRKHANFLLWIEVILLAMMLIALLTSMTPITLNELRFSASNLRTHMVSELLRSRGDLKTSHLRIDPKGEKEWHFSGVITGTRPPRSVSGTLRLTCDTISGEEACWELRDVKRDNAPLELIVSTAVASEDVRQWVVIADRVNGRNGPGTNHGVVQSFNKGAPVLLLEARGTWGRFQSGNGAVWISLAYVEPAA